MFVFQKALQEKVTELEKQVAVAAATNSQQQTALNASQESQQQSQQQ